MKKSQQVAIVIPVHNRKNYTYQCISSLRKQTYKEFIIVLIDDGSTDGTKEMLASEFPEVKVLSGDGNLWWTKATNVGAKYAIENGAAYILTINNDTIAMEDFLEKMMYWAEKTPDALLGAVAIDATTKKYNYGGELMNWKYDSSLKLLDVLAEKDRNGIHEVSHFPGRGLLLHKSVFEKIGFFDEINFPHYGADNEFTMRARRKGYKVFCNYDAKLLIYPEENSDTSLRKKKNLFNFFRHCFGRKGKANLIIFYKLAVRSCPPKYLPQNLFIGTVRRIIGYWVK